MAAAVSWDGLPSELWSDVLDRLDAMSILRFAAVCTTWSAVCKEKTTRLRSGSPTMITSGLEEGEIEACCNSIYNYKAGIFALHDVSTGKSIDAEADGLKSRCWIGGKDDWLVTTDGELSVELLNPVTGDRACLPSFATIPGVTTGKKGSFCVDVADGHISPQLIQRIALCQTPVHREGYIAVAMFSSDLLAFTASGDKRWTALKKPAVERWIRYTDTIVHERKVLAVSMAGGVYSWQIEGAEIEGPAVVREPDVRSPQSYKFHLAKSGDGQILLICMYGYRQWDSETWRKIYDDDIGSFHMLGISLLQLDTSNHAWLPVSELGSDRTLFLGANYPFYITVRQGSKDLKANSIYIADLSGSDAVVLGLGLGDRCTTDRLDYRCDSDPFQMPMWFRPTTHLV